MLHNYTPHKLRLFRPLNNRSGLPTDEPYETLESEGNVRVLSQQDGKAESGYTLIGEDTNHPDAWVAVVPAPKLDGEIVGLPERKGEIDENTGLIVSALAAPRVAQVWPGPVYSPDTGPDGVVRDSGGEILGVRQLCRWK